MASLKGTKTENNLKDAFAGVSQANRRYLYFAQKADVEGYNDVSAVFRSTAEGEAGHAHGHLEYHRGNRRPGDRRCRSARPIQQSEGWRLPAAETHEYTDMYPGMARGPRVMKASRRSPIGSRRLPRPSARMPAVSSARSTRSDHLAFLSVERGRGSQSLAPFV